MHEPPPARRSRRRRRMGTLPPSQRRTEVLDIFAAGIAGSTLVALLFMPAAYIFVKELERRSTSRVAASAARSLL